ncbi:hypothetical protein Taro_021498 [Colocasia esculenta]|uniref:AB hydrolase-1 domain-containing protein n=1 Tax=Colocasia esculenta TaxID=4460 RepID=A0A843V8D9_COLES|nr:hypothetical protein [Colocasia esculenta]
MEEEEAKAPSRPHHHFVLVHGAGHGAWCWYKLRVLLEDAGHKVSCLDLAGAGIHPSDTNSILTFEAYNKPLMDFMSQLPENEKVILVGHSAGGLSVTYATYKFGSKIEVAVYIGASMLRAGLSSEQDIKNGFPDLSSGYGSDVFELNFGLGPELPPTTVAIRKEFQRQILYQLSSVEDSTLASMLLRPWPTMALSKASWLGGEEVGAVRRVFVKTAHDRTLTPEQQEAMIKRWPPCEVVELDSDHCPFFSAPRQLFHALLQASTSSPYAAASTQLEL